MRSALPAIQFCVGIPRGPTKLPRRKKPKLPKPSTVNRHKSLQPPEPLTFEQLIQFRAQRIDNAHVGSPEPDSFYRTIPDRSPDGARTHRLAAKVRNTFARLRSSQVSE